MRKRWRTNYKVNKMIDDKVIERTAKTLETDVDTLKAKADVVYEAQGAALRAGGKSDEEAYAACLKIAGVQIRNETRALRNSGVVDMIARQVKPFTKNQTLHISSLSSVIAMLSAFMNNVGALALMLPVTLKTSWDQKRPPGILLMPVAFA